MRRGTPSPLRPLVKTTRVLAAREKYDAHRVRSGSLILSIWFSTTSRSLVPIHSGMLGWPVDSGMRASRTCSRKSGGVSARRVTGVVARQAGSYVQHDVHQAQLLLELLLGARDVARVPLRRGGGVAAASATTLERLAGAAAPPDVRASVQRSRSQAPHDGTGPHAAV